MRRPGRQRTRHGGVRRAALWALPVLLVTGALWYSFAVTSFLRRNRATADRGLPSKGLACVGWRQTRSCTPYGVRDPGGDRGCQDWISRDAGYCKCEGFLATKHMECGSYVPFTCEIACGRLAGNLLDAEQLPANVTCRPAEHGGSLLGAAATWLHTAGRSSAGLQGLQGAGARREADARAARLWGGIAAALDAAGPSAVWLPETRGTRRDWVLEGVRLPRAAVQAARAQWRRFLAAAPAYPPAAFGGRGVVILAGGLTYMVPSWVNIHMLRRTGCTLPVEMFFPEKEYPTPALEAALGELGVVCRRLPAMRPDDTQASLTGFTMKIAALILSRFREVIFLDSDNVAVADPAALFASAAYRGSGALLWPDYWDSSAAPDLAGVLGVERLPGGTFESGQMAFDKQRTWSALLLAAYFNLRAGLYYELFSNFMGKGDKESFAHALEATRTPYAVVPHAVGSVGEVRRQCRPSGACETLFLGNTMTQFAPDGSLMFLHTNLSPKWSLEIPGNFSFYRRRWQTIVPGERDFVEQLGDVERVVYEVLVALRCADFLPSYVEVLSDEERMGEGTDFVLGLRGFHPVNPGVDFRQAHRWGLSGPFLAFTEVSVADRARNFLNTAVWSRLGYSLRFLWKCSRPFSRTYFALW